MLNRKIAIFKSSAPEGPRPRLTHKSVAANYRRGWNTTLIPDANILVSIERLMKRGGRWSEIKASGIGELVSLLKKCPPFSIYLSPGIALHEIPPGNAQATEQAFNKFLELYLPNFVDSPDSVPLSTVGGDTGPYGFHDLAIPAQRVLGIPYVSLMHMITIELGSNISPLEKFRRYLDSVVKAVDVVSLKEAQIARYVFAPTGPLDAKTQKLCSVVRANFLKTKKRKLPRSATEIQTVAFNSAMDLNLMNAADILEGNGTGNLKHEDAWIVTSDLKLAEYANVVRGMTFGGAVGMAREIHTHVGEGNHRYWSESLKLYTDLQSTRVDIWGKDIDFDRILESASCATKAAQSLFQGQQ